MATVRPAALADGMILARDIVDSAGRVVIPAGTRVDPALRSRLIKANIRSIEVRDGDDGDAGTGDAGKSDSVVIQGHLMRIAHMFNDHRDDPIMRELCRLAIKCAQERLISG